MRSSLSCASVARCPEVKPFTDHFSGVAPAYASCRPGYPDELFTYLAEITRRHELAWDCAAGNGQAAIPLARTFRHVLATDISAPMLDRAPRDPRVEYRVAPAQSSGLAPASANLVTVAQALHWIETGPFYKEVDRVLEPGGVLAVWSYGMQQVDDPALDRILEHFYRDVVGPYWLAERRHVETGYTTLPFPYGELQPPALVMEERWTLSELLGYVGTWSATQRFRTAVGHDPLLDLAEELGQHWGRPASARLVRWPLALRVGRRSA
jgi:ubiquinone/menaquinone biosynthesis C-methylase UbiE